MIYLILLFTGHQLTRTIFFTNDILTWSKWSKKTQRITIIFHLYQTINIFAVICGSYEQILCVNRPLSTSVYWIWRTYLLLMLIKSTKTYKNVPIFTKYYSYWKITATVTIDGESPWANRYILRDSFHSRVLRKS